MWIINGAIYLISLEDNFYFDTKSTNTRMREKEKLILSNF